jgi:hypothetical protein
MRENLLHFIWEFQYFLKNDLTTIEGEPVSVLYQGLLNTNAGPDFSNARIKIGSVEWFGHVEIHVKSSEWNSHSHQSDKAYDNVVLHVVWQHDKKAFRSDGTEIPVIELKNRIDHKLYDKYRDFINSSESIPCRFGLNRIPGIVKLSMLEKVLHERLQDKGEKVSAMLQQNNNDWEETAYQLLMQNFGFKLNNEPFLKLGKAIPYKVIRKHKHNLKQVEALLFGMAGLLDRDFKDSYPQELKKEFSFLSHKYALGESKMEAFEWKFLRIRPANFPSVRIAQLASLLNHLPDVFSTLLEIQEPKQIHHMLTVSCSSYWNRHYVFEKDGEEKEKSLGQSGIENICINTIVPLMVAYALEKDDHTYIEKAVSILESLKPESNRITKLMGEAGFDYQHAFDTQAGIHLYNNYCKKKRCLDCTIGVDILKSSC